MVKDEDRLAIEQALENWSEGWRTKDPRLATQDYSDDADWTNAFGMARRGREEIAELLANVFALPFVMAGRGNTVKQSTRFLDSDVALVATRVERVGQRTRAGEALGTRRTSHLRVFSKTGGAWMIVSHLISDARETESPKH